MKLIRKGLTLIEFLIYLLLFSTMATISAYWVSTAWQIMGRFSHRCNEYITLHIAHDLLVRDIHRASSQRKAWKKIAPDMLIWQSNQRSLGDKDIGWQYKNGQLIRLEGTFDAKADIWNKKTQSVVAQSITDVQFRTFGQNDIEQIRFELRGKELNKGYLVANTVLVRTRKLS